MGLTPEEMRAREDSLQRLRITTYKDKKGYAFISYKSDNWKKVFESKVFALQEMGLQLYSDKNFDDTNRPWLGAMERNIRHASVFIMFISEEYLKSYATLIELLSAINYQLPIVPIYLEEKNALFKKLKNDVDLEDDLVVMDPTESDRLKALLFTAHGNKASNLSNMVERIQMLCTNKIAAQEFAVRQIVESFDILLNGGVFSDNYFDRNISSLVNTIKDATANLDPEKQVFGAPVKVAAVSDLAPASTPTPVSEPAPAPAAAAAAQAPVAVRPPKPAGTQTKSAAASVPPSGNLAYTLYGETGCGNQSEVMIRTFEKVLKKHPQYIDQAIEKFTCLSGTDYSDDQNKGEGMPSYFRVCHTFEIDGKTVCIGTAYSLKDKLVHIAKLFDLVGESHAVLQIEGMELPAVKKKTAHAPAALEDSALSGGEVYFIEGKMQRGNQAQMMWDVAEIVFARYPHKATELCALTSIKKASDVQNLGTRDCSPSYFRVYKSFEVNGTEYLVGASYGRDAKLQQIKKMIQLSGAPDDLFSLTGRENSTKETHRGRKKKDYVI